MATKGLLNGLKVKAPSKDDASRKPPSGSVNSETTRSTPGYVGSAPGGRVA